MTRAAELSEPDARASIDVTSGRERARAGSRSELKEATARVWRHVASSDGVTRAALGSHLDMSRSALADVLAELIDSGLVHEDGFVRHGRGRPSALLRVRPQVGRILLADLGSSHAVVGVADLSGVVQSSQYFPLSIADGPDAVIGWLTDTFAQQMVSVGVPDTGIAYVGIGVPGPVDGTRSGVTDAPNMPGWNHVDIAERVRDRLGVQVDVLVENDANCLAVGAYRSNWIDQVKNLVLVKVGTGIGCGLIVDGRLCRGEENFAGEIGHTYVPSSTARCSCGNVGCLDTVASGRAIVGQLQLAGLSAVVPRDVATLVREGEAYASSQLRNAGRTIGEVVGGLVNFVNPGALVLAGALGEGEAGAQLMAGLRESLYRRTPPSVTRSLRIAACEASSQPGLLGIASLVTDAIVSPEWLSTYLANSPRSS